MSTAARRVHGSRNANILILFHRTNENAPITIWTFLPTLNFTTLSDIANIFHARSILVIWPKKNKQELKTLHQLQISKSQRSLEK